MEKDGKTTKFIDQIFDGLKAAASEIDNLRVKAALGRAEAQQFFEEIKKNLDNKLHEARASVDKLKEKEELVGLVNSFEFLQVQLALGIAETREMFEDQEKKISHAISELEAKIRSNDTYQRYAGPLKMDIEKFRIKLELLALHYKLDKISMQEEFKEKKALLLEKLDALKEKMIGDKAREQWNHFEDEMGQAFRHLKNAFTRK